MHNSKITNKIAIGILYFLTSLTLIAVIGLIGIILWQDLPDVSWHFLTSKAESFLAGGGIRDQLVDSLYLLVMTLVISTPLALGAAIYLSEYAPKNKLTDLLRTTIEVLSSLPSIVVGLFGYLIFVVKFHLGFSVLAGAIALTFFNLPILTRNFEESLRAVPLLQRQGGWALGLSQWHTIRKVVIPTAMPSLLTGLILSAGRVFGEAAALIFTAGQSAATVNYSNWNPFMSDSFLNPLRPAETLAVHIWKVNSEGLIPDAQKVANGSTAVLVLMVLLFNICARLLGAYLKKRQGNKN